MICHYVSQQHFYQIRRQYLVSSLWLCHTSRQFGSRFRNTSLNEQNSRQQRILTDGGRILKHFLGETSPKSFLFSDLLPKSAFS